ncbi:hypothetical protein EPK99_17560 [Neorhizobium lilium]|uniref:Uncharacterized protein n=1 Tax=Neorhizobium lilium TaxID=2503024 RepID=A0A3S4UJY8_9HYPH|nr:hypothetical protein [Neorhizobium lilium]RWX75508.1 hypothetical protein EPK99_17560 [Neorhizobium lilium]
MDLRQLLVSVVVLLPQAAVARDIAACADLYRQLRNTPEIIGNTQEIRRYAQELGQKNNDIRNLRTEMRRNGCGGGSIVKLGGVSDGNCEDMRQNLQTLESERESLVVERRNGIALVRSTDERTPILAAIRENSCIPSDLEEQQRQEEEERLKVQGLELPKEQPYSGIVDLRGRPQRQTAAAGPPPVPDRPYDPNKKVRTVGPVFFPEESIDLAHPRLSGTQPQQ